MDLLLSIRDFLFRPSLGFFFYLTPLVFFPIFLVVVFFM
jgi:hypothetical protein